MIQSGKLRERIKIEREVSTRTSSGATTESISSVGNFRACITNTYSSYVVNAEKESALYRYTILLRTPKDVEIKIDDMITDLATNRKFTVESIVYKDYNTYLELGCEELV